MHYTLIMPIALPGDRDPASVEEGAARQERGRFFADS
jgi:hypothetical protein